MFQIKGKVALLIGALRGISNELARQLLQNQARAVVIAEPVGEVGKIAVQRLKDEFGEMRVHMIQADITNLKELEGVFVSTIKLYDNLDIVINNVGVVDESDIDRSQNIAVVTAMRSTKLAVNVFLPQNKLGTEAVVININAVVSLGNSPTMNVGGLAGLTAGTQYERNNVRVISLYLGSSQQEILNGLGTNQLVQTISNISELRSQQGIETAGRALIGAIEQGINGSSWVGTRQQQTLQQQQQQLQQQLQQLQQQLQQQQVQESTNLGNWGLSQMRL